ncbi:uncharacterized protein LOC135838729 isoform X2 [Planococcus citri]|uniref:uncharacterized protein LOC135838729 isoform X2 n=1 Tax=Planococcus citri TaxID=170843 RepID=UPI0031F8EF00
MGRFSGKQCRMISMFWLNTICFFVEILYGYITNSTTLVADSVHMLSDVATLVVAFISNEISSKKWSKSTFGLARAEVLGAFVNAVFLVALCLTIAVDACKRLIQVEDIRRPELIYPVGVLGLIVNVIGLFLFHDHGGHSHSHSRMSHNHSKLKQLASAGATNATATDDNENAERFQPPNLVHEEKSTSSQQMNMRGVFLHCLADALNSVIVIISAMIVCETNWKYKNYVDPTLSLLMVTIILRSVWSLLRETALILLQTFPPHIQVDEIRSRLLKNFNGISAVHEFHVWQLTSDKLIASAHIRYKTLSEYTKLAEKVEEFFHNEGIHSITIQSEFVESLTDRSSSN